MKTLKKLIKGFFKHLDLIFALLFLVFAFAELILNDNEVAFFGWCILSYIVHAVHILTNAIEREGRWIRIEAQARDLRNLDLAIESISIIADSLKDKKEEDA